MPEDFNKVQLTAQETEVVIFNARCEKYWNKKKQEKNEAAIKIKLEAKRPFTAKELGEYVLQTNPWFKVDEQCQEIFNLLCLYFSGDREFEKRGYSLQKGICLCGPVGVGKTELLNIFRANKRQSFQLITVFDIESALQTNGVEFVKSYYGWVPGWTNQKQFFFQQYVGWAFDDVGRESVVFDFGNKTDAISKILQHRYFNKAILPFFSLHITSNKTPDELEKRYDEAVRSRQREMFNYIEYDGKDRRK